MKNQQIPDVIKEGAIDALDSELKEYAKTEPTTRGGKFARKIAGFPLLKYVLRFLLIKKI